jgi:hypothetical protein
MKTMKVMKTMATLKPDAVATAQPRLAPKVIPKAPGPPLPLPGSPAPEFSQTTLVRTDFVEVLDARVEAHGQVKALELLVKAHDARMEKLMRLHGVRSVKCAGHQPIIVERKGYEKLDKTLLMEKLLEAGVPMSVVKSCFAAATTVGDPTEYFAVLNKE